MFNPKTDRVMNAAEDQTLKKAMAGDIRAFQTLFSPFQDQLRSYLYRLLASRADADDFTHDTFIRSFEKIHQYRGDSTLKTWVFQIATSLAYNYLQRRKRWQTDVSEQAKKLVQEQESLAQAIVQVSTQSEAGNYDIREHIDTCFTCISKTLPIENQVALILKDIYEFTVPEIMLILGKSEGAVKYLIQLARKTMTEVFDQRCALVNKEGICHQCSELNGWLNPKQNQQEAQTKLDMARHSTKYDREELFALRVALVKNIDPLHSPGNEMQEILMRCNRMA
ncbi:MAG: RNA polymerase sigma factor, partial [Bacteroidia bacterium]|nr:RNA polymerase sigma factor [Bacteroidia bacterium]